VVEDDGRGFGPGDERNRESTGLTGIRERALNLGGTAEAGCRLEVWLPLARVLRPGRDANA
jgi:signal transduction histidine kinase